MKTMLTKSIFIVAIIFCTVKASNTNAQCKIMDAAITFSGSGTYTGTLKVFLTDISGLSGLQIDMGSTADTFDLYSTTYTISNNSFGNGGTVIDNVLTIGIGSFSFHANYYTRIRVMLANGQFNEIVIHTTN